MDYRISAACRDNCVYTFKRYSTGVYMYMSLNALVYVELYTEHWLMLTHTRVHTHTHIHTLQLHFSGSTTPRYNISLASQSCGLLRVNKDIIVGCMDNTLTCYTHKGKKLWGVHLPATITSVEQLHYRPRSFKAVLVALQNREVRIYKDRFLVNCIEMDVRQRERLQ